ncbi:MAG: hypothetical protein IT462_14155 [Planctomycetes bacterium]|nr:hypothetical protein [Planctomycetota bacterium]
MARIHYWSAGVLAFALVAVAAQFPVSAQAQKFKLEEKFSVGLRRSVTTKRTYTEIREFMAAGEAASRLTDEFTRDSLVHEWYTDLDENARPKRFLRTYQKLDRKLKGESYIKMIDRTDKTEKTIDDSRAGQIITLERADGKLKVIDGAKNIFGDKALDNVIKDVETNLLPAAEKSPGDSWTVPGCDLEFLRDEAPSMLIDDTTETCEGGDLKITFDNMGSNEAGPVALLKFEGKFKFVRMRKDPILGDEVTNYVVNATVEGNLEFDTTRGRLISRTLNATFDNSGKVDRQEMRGSGKLTEYRVYHYGYILEAAPDNGVEAPAKTTETKTTAGDRLDPAHIVLALNGAERARLVVFDPVKRKAVRTLASFAAGVRIDHVTLAQTRDRIAFSSTLNNEISHATWNVFVLEISSGKINQVTPSWATGDGLAKPFESAGKGRVTGKVVWSDNERNTARSDNFSGNVHIDQTGIKAVVGIGGMFALDNVPAGFFALARVTGKVTARRLDGKDDGRTSANWSGSAGGMVKAGETLDLGTITLQPVQADMVFCNATFLGDRITGHLYGFGWLWDAGYPQRSWDMPTKDVAPGGQIYGLGYRPDGLIALANGYGKDARVRFLNPSRIVTATGDLSKLAIQHGTVASRGTWDSRNEQWVAGGYGPCRSGTIFADMPLVYRVLAADGTVELVRDWPEFTGRSIVDITPAQDGQSYFLVVQIPAPPAQPGKPANEAKTNLYRYTPATDTLERLTSLDDVQSVANTGR